MPLAVSFRSPSRVQKLLQVGYQRRSNPRYQHALVRLLREARLLGSLTAVQTQWAQEAAPLRGWPRRFTMPEAELRRFGYADMRQFRNWMWYPPDSAGPYCDFVAHQLDVCQWFLGCAAHAVLATGGSDHYTDRPHLDTVLALYEFPSQAGDQPGRAVRASCSMFTTSSGGGTRQYERFLGTEGSIQMSSNLCWTVIGR